MRTVQTKQRRHIFDTAARLFAERRFHEVRMDDIADQAEVSKGTLYRYFADKETLYRALILDCLGQMLAQTEAEVGRSGSPQERLRRFVGTVVRFHDERPYLFELIQRMEGAHAGRETSPLAESRAKFVGLLAGLLREVGGRGGPGGFDPDLAALALVGMTREVLRSMPAPRGESLAEWIVAQFLHGVHGPR